MTTQTQLRIRTSRLGGDPPVLSVAESKSQALKSAEATVQHCVNCMEFIREKLMQIVGTGLYQEYYYDRELYYKHCPVLRRTAKRVLITDGNSDERSLPHEPLERAGRVEVGPRNNRRQFVRGDLARIELERQLREWEQCAQRAERDLAIARQQLEAMDAGGTL